MIINANGKQYTSATEDVALQQLKQEAARKLYAEIGAALRRPGPQMQVDPSCIFEAIEQAYYLGKENAVK